MDDAIDSFQSKIENGSLKILENILNWTSLGIELDDLLVAAEKILISLVESGFKEKVKNRRKEIGGKRAGLQEVCELVLDEMFGELSYSVTQSYYELLGDIQKRLQDDFPGLSMGKKVSGDVTKFSLGVGEADQVLDALFSPDSPFPLAVDRVLIASRPRQELINVNRERFPDTVLRFCIKDIAKLPNTTFGNRFNKSVIDGADAIIFLLDLKKPEYSLKETCDAVAKESGILFNMTKRSVPTTLLFTRADELITAKVRRASSSFVLKEEDYKKFASAAIEEVEGIVDRCSESLACEENSWLNKQYKDISWLSLWWENDCALQRTLVDSGYKLRFEPSWLFTKVVDLVKVAEINSLPFEVERPIRVEVEDSTKPPFIVRIDSSHLGAVCNQIQWYLTENKEEVHGYVVQDKVPQILATDAYNYLVNLRAGLGHTSKSLIGGRFTINMLGLLKKALLREIPDFSAIFPRESFEVDISNLSESALSRIVKAFNCNPLAECKDLDEFAVVCENSNSVTQQVISDRCWDFLARYEVFRSLIDRVAFDLICDNYTIRAAIARICKTYTSYDRVIREIQGYFWEFFRYEHFSEACAYSFLGNMEKMLNKWFVMDL